MPYIVQEKRALIDPILQDALSKIKEACEKKGEPLNEGDLNYIISSIMVDFLYLKGKKYATINTIMGVLSCAEKEFYRRVAVPYEDLKIDVNGDVPGFSD